MSACAAALHLARLPAFISWSGMIRLQLRPCSAMYINVTVCTDDSLATLDVASQVVRKKEEDKKQRAAPQKVDLSLWTRWPDLPPFTRYFHPWSPVYADLPRWSTLHSTAISTPSRYFTLARQTTQPPWWFVWFQRKLLQWLQNG